MANLDPEGSFESNHEAHVTQDQRMRTARNRCREPRDAVDPSRNVPRYLLAARGCYCRVDGPPLSLVPLTSTFVWRQWRRRRRRTRTLTPFNPFSTIYLLFPPSLLPTSNPNTLSSLLRTWIDPAWVECSLSFSQTHWACASEYWTPVLRDVSTCKLSLDVQSRKGAWRGDRQPWTLENVDWLLLSAVRLNDRDSEHFALIGDIGNVRL